MIVPPSGSGGVSLGFVQSPAINFPARAQDPNEAAESHGDTGFSEGGFNDELLLHDLSSMERDADNRTLGLGREMFWHAHTNQFAVNGDPAVVSEAMPFKPNLIPGFSGPINNRSSYNPASGMPLNPTRS
jgi:hypothetical protein